MNFYLNCGIPALYITGTRFKGASTEIIDIFIINEFGGNIGRILKACALELRNLAWNMSQHENDQ